MVDTRSLPAAVDAERLVLGAVLLDVGLLHAARPVLTPEDFSVEKHRLIWRRIAEQYDAGHSVDKITVYEDLAKYGEAEACGGLSYLVDLDSGLPQTPALDAYLSILREKTTLRNIITACHQMTERCFRGTENPQQLLDSMGRAILELAPQRNDGGGLQSCAELIEEVGLQNLLRPRRDQGLTFPWAWMNAVTCGMLPSELWILAGHTSTGKTSAMLQHAVHAARHGVATAIFSLEVGKGSLFNKAVYQLSGVDSERGKQGKLTQEERNLVGEAAAELRDLPLYFDTQSTTTMAIHAAVRRRRLKSKVDHVIVDYLQLLGNTGRHDSRAQAVGANAWALKMLATDFQVPVLLLSQFNRESAKPNQHTGKMRKPELTDLKESGDIENHANGVWFIHRELLADMEQVPVEFMLPKQRDGRRNIFKEFMFMPQYQRFEERA